MNCTEALKVCPSSVRAFVYRGALKSRNRVSVPSAGLSVRGSARGALRPVGRPQGSLPVIRLPVISAGAQPTTTVGL